MRHIGRWCRWLTGKKLAEKYVGTLENFNQNMTALYKEGYGYQGGLLSVSVRLNQAEMALLRVKNGLGLARMALNRICGLPVDTVFVLQEEDLNQLALPEKMELEQVYSNRPRFTVCRWRPIFIGGRSGLPVQSICLR